MHRIEKFSDEFVTKFFQQSVGKLNSDQIERFLNECETVLPNYYFTKTSEINLLRILENQFQLNLFINDVLKYNHYLEILLTITSYSNYLTDTIVQNPEFFYWITNPDTLKKKITRNYYKKHISKIHLNYKSFQSKLNILKNFKKQEILRIGILDYFLNTPLTKITELLSLLANTICSYLFSLCLEETKKKYGVKKLPQYCIVSLGKLGGNELNYSSDIDLIIFTETNEHYNDYLFSNTIYENAIKLFINSSSQLTEKGDLYRIDFRLRPYGRNAELVNTISNYLYYYENQSEPWEKQMLIKCSYFSGSKKLNKRFNDYIQGIIYPKTFLKSPVEKLRAIKSSIEKNIGTDQNIKLSSGGIRDIEFSVQALQLINAGKNPELREKNTLKALSKLFKYKLIDKEEFIQLKENYLLFRKIEHFLQLMNNFQTHSIPESTELLEKLSFKLGYSDTNTFLQDIHGRKSFNAAFFNGIVNNDNATSNLEKVVFSDRAKALINFNYLNTGYISTNQKKFDEPTVNSFNSISDSIIFFVEKSKNPDQALDNFTKLVKSHPFPKSFFDILNDSKLLKLTLTICERSKFLFDILLESKQALDLFITRKVFKELNEEAFDEYNYQLFKFAAGIQLFAGIIDVTDFQKLQKKYLLFHLNNIILEKGILKKYKNDAVIIGLGSFASEEMNLFSDIDLIFILKNLDKYPNAQRDFQDLLIEFRYKLNLDIDCRLRPEGKSSPLVWNFHDCIRYIESRAELWEFLTFTKSILVSGNSKLFKELIIKIGQKVSFIDVKKVKSDLNKMRDKLTSNIDYLINLKKSKGGLVDLYFILGYYSLMLYNKRDDLFELPASEKFNAIWKLSDEKLILEKIQVNYFFLKKFEIYYQLLSGYKSIKFSDDDEYLKYLCEIFQFNSISNLTERLNKILTENIKLYNKIFLTL